MFVVTLVLPRNFPPPLPQHDGALHLLYEQAYEEVAAGKLLGDESVMVQLDALSDPAFVAKRQYVELAQSLPGYETVVIERCVLRHFSPEARARRSGIPACLRQGEPVQLEISKNGLTVGCRGGTDEHDQDERELFLFSWPRIRQWTSPPPPVRNRLPRFRRSALQ